MRLSFVIILLIILSSCNYELSDIPFTTVEKTNVTDKPTINFSINKDSVDLFETTAIKITTLANGLRLNKLELEYLTTKLTRKTNEIANSSISFTGTNTPSSWFNLTAKLYYGTNSGSIADVMGLENNLLEKKLAVRFISNTDYYLTLKSRINKDSVVELYWVKPKYATSISASLPTTTYAGLKGDTSLYIPTDYVSGYRFFELNALLSSSVTGKYSTTLNYALPTLKTEKIGTDSCRVYALGTIKRNFYITSGSESKFFVNQCSFSYTSVLPALNQSKVFRVEFLPVSAIDPNKVMGETLTIGLFNR